MKKRACNSKFPERISIHGQFYSGPTEIYRNIEPKPVINLSTFLGRMRKLLLVGKLNEKEISEALYSSTDEYFKKKAVRKSWININGKKIDLFHYYQKSINIVNVDYSVFRSRLKKSNNIEQFDKNLLVNAITFSTDHWISFYGGGRHRTFTYRGEFYPDCYEKKFHGIIAFLRIIGRYYDKDIVWSRLKLGWDIDNALSIPVDFKTERKGRIYKITRISTGQVYIGLTFSSINQRWKFHLSLARKNPKTRFAKAISKDGAFGFKLEILEDNINSSSTLVEREKYWVDKFNARGPDGLNTAPPGGLGSSKGIAVIYEGESFDSITEAAYILSKKYNIPTYTAERCIRKEVSLPTKTRKHSKHKDAGSNLFRRWLALKRRHKENMVSQWLDSYDCFIKDVGDCPQKGMRLIRKNYNEPLGPNNFYWGNKKEFIESVHGKDIVVNGKSYSSIKALSDDYGIGYSPLKNRINKQKLSPEVAVKLPLGPTSNKNNQSLK